MSNSERVLCQGRNDWNWRCNGARATLARVNTKPSPSPEGQLIKSYLGDAGISVRQAAARTGKGLSYSNWRQYLDGVHLVEANDWREKPRNPHTLARMALFAGVPADELERVGTPLAIDAAASLRELEEHRARQQANILRRVPLDDPDVEIFVMVRDGAQLDDTDVRRIVREALTYPTR